MTTLFVNMLLVVCLGFLWLSPYTTGSVLPNDAAVVTNATPVDGTSDIHPDSQLHAIAEDITTADAKVDTPAICSKDSHLVEGICKCSHSACEEPSCERFLNLATNATDKPGHCCPTYTCDDCVDKHLIGGKCVCPEESIISEKGICECLDRHKSIVNNTCECDQRKCPLPDLCSGNSIGVRQLVGCCTSVKCIDCPEDSYPKEYNSDLIEDICVCQECHDNPTCDDGFELIVEKQGTNIPGNCCSEFKCVPSYCLFEGNQYKNGEKWFTDDNSECSCNSGTLECYPLSGVVSDNNSCLVNNSVVPHHHTWMEEDGCTNCTCNNGEPTCTAHFCNVKHVEVPTQECPQVPCKRPCKHGYKYKNGCQTCRCKLNDKHNNVDYKETTTESNVIVKFKLLEQFMRSHNLSEEDTIVKLQDYYRNLRVSPSTTLEPEKSTMDSSPYTPEHAISLSSWVVMVGYALVGFVIGFASGWLLQYYKKSSSKKYNNNNNISPKSYSLTSDTKSSEKKLLNELNVTR